MTTENKRDLAADLAICDAATEYVSMCVGETEVFCDYMDPELPHGFHVAEFVRTKDAEFFVEAREGWPEAIRQAMAAEAEVVRLTSALEEAQYHLYREQYMSATDVVDSALGEYAGGS